MTKEKELGIFIAEMVNSLPDSGDNFKDCFTLAKAIIQRYPQILAEKVWEGDVGTIFANGKCVYQTEFFDMPNKEWKNHLKKVQLFIREVVS